MSVTIKRHIRCLTSTSFTTISRFYLWIYTRHSPLLPPKYHKQPSRPKKVSKRVMDKPSKDVTKLKRLYTLIKSKNCRQEGHNIRIRNLKKKMRHHHQFLSQTLRNKEETNKEGNKQDM